MKISSSQRRSERKREQNQVSGNRTWGLTLLVGSVGGEVRASGSTHSQDNCHRFCSPLLSGHVVIHPRNLLAGIMSNQHTKDPQLNSIDRKYNAPNE